MSHDPTAFYLVLPQHPANPEIQQLLPPDQDHLALVQFPGVHSFQREKRSVKNHKCGSRKYRKGQPLDPLLSPEYIGVTERPEPERIDVIGRHGAAAENDGGDDGENDQATAPPWRWTRPIEGLKHDSGTHFH